MSDKPRLDRLRALAEANLQLQQFGQKNDDEVHDGKTACTHVVCQFLSLAWNGDIPTLNEVNRMAGMDPNERNEAGKPRGMRPGELETFIRKAKIPMARGRGLKFADVLKASDDGPVFYAMRYGSAPKRTKAHPNGTTQMGGHVADTRHAVVMLGFDTIPGAGGAPGRIVYRKDPNHGSGNRDERPPYDTLSDRQARIEYEDYKTILGETLSSFLPTRPLPVIGKFALPPVQPPPALVVTDLQPFNGIATVRGDGHSAVQIADRQFVGLPDGALKQVVALGRLVPRLPGPAGNRTHVVVVGDEAAILLRADIVLRTNDGIEVPAPAGEAEELVPIGPEIPVPPGDPPGDNDEVSNGELSPD